MLAVTLLGTLVSRGGAFTSVALPALREACTIRAACLRVRGGGRVSSSFYTAMAGDGPLEGGNGTLHAPRTSATRRVVRTHIRLCSFSEGSTGGTLINASQSSTASAAKRPA